MSAPKRIIELVETFKENEEIYKDANRYDEENTKIDFINPFFEELGWDVNNRQQFAPAYKEVVFEDKVKTNDGTKAPDYSFRLGGVIKFYVEAKKPNVKLETDKKPSFQLRRYAWSKGLKISVLTDFETLAIYEIKTKPEMSQAASIDRVKFYHYKDYIEKWDEIESILSKDAVLKGKFDNFIKDKGRKKKGTAEVDKEFLKEIEGWREVLAKNIALRNKTLNEEDINYAVQLTIDRLLFLRIAEDRHIEKYGRLKKIAEKKEGIYKEFGKLCKEADKVYNSGLFHFENEKDEHYVVDNYTLDLTIDDKTLKDIIKNLYYPNSPYEFSVISTEILGKVYEQFLGSTIRLTPTHQAKVDIKPEVKKAKGVFYTPEFIVNYIVKKTVGEKIDGKTPDEISNIKIIDPSCGSGTFLLRAYQYLLDYHLNYYLKQEKIPKNIVYQWKDDEYRLTIQEKKRILLNNIYGVDLDPLAVEVTKLSLLLKVLEDQTKDELEQQRTLFKQRVLPNLTENIKCGNSLITDDIENLTFEEKLEIKPFNWEIQYKEIFDDKGFDVVIGNPPYINIQYLNSNQKVLDYYTEKYESSTGSYDSYVIFVEKGYKLLKENGILGYILPNRFFLADYGVGLRKTLTNNACIKQLINFKDNQVFDRASTYTCLLFLQEGNQSFKYAESEFIQDFEKTLELIDNHDSYDDYNTYVESFETNDFSEQFRFYPGKTGKITIKLMEHPLKLGDITKKIFQGLATSSDKIFILDLISENKETMIFKSPEDKKEYVIEKDLVKKYVKGKTIQKYHVDFKNKYLIFPYSLSDDSYEILDEKYIKNNYPYGYNYLKTHEKKLRSRENKKMNKKGWFGYTYPKSMCDYQKQKIITPNSAFNSSFTLDINGEYYLTAGVAGGYGILFKEEYEKLSSYYVLSILNSSLMNFLTKKISTCLRGKYYSYEGRNIQNYPIIEISEEEQEPFIKLAKYMLDLNEKLNLSNNASEKQLIEQEIITTDKKIDQLVYDLYDISNDEIKDIEKYLELFKK